MTKTSPIPDDAHAILIGQQEELKRKYKIIVRISDLIAMYIKDGAKRTEKLLGIGEKHEDDNVSDHYSIPLTQGKDVILNRKENKIELETKNT